MNMCIRKWSITLLLILHTGLCAAGEGIEIVARSGNIGIVSGNLIRPLQGNVSVPSGTTLATSGNARAVVRVGSTGYIVLGESSRIRIGKPADHAGLFRQITGIIYYAINTLKGDRKGDRHPINVRTDVSSLGIRGTRFMVITTPDKAEVAMRKGVIAVQSTDGEFELYKHIENDQFEAYQQQAEQAMQHVQREFEEYQDQSRQAFLKYTEEFDLSANQMVSIDGKRATTRGLSAEAENEMGDMERYAGQWLKQVHD